MEEENGCRCDGFVVEKRHGRGAVSARVVVSQSARLGVVWRASRSRCVA
jgi:hypothetical protein